jgi:hypothetical protein
MIDPGRGRCHDVGLMSAVESRSPEKLLQLVSRRNLDDFLERHKVGRDSPDLAVEQIDATRVACGVPHVDGKDSQVHVHPSRPGDTNLPSPPQRAPARCEAGLRCRMGSAQEQQRYRGEHDGAAEHGGRG